MKVGSAQEQGEHRAEQRAATGDQEQVGVGLGLGGQAQL
jgi:hypothetical protein